MIVPIETFRGEVPAVAPRLLKPGYAQRARNARLENGNLEAFRAPAAVTPSQIGGLLKSFRLYRGAHWFKWGVDVDMIRAPISGDTQDRVIITGDGPPKITDAAIATGGALMPAASYRLGVPAPLAAPILNITGTGEANGAVELRSYVYTYVNSYGQEGPPSPPSETKQWQAGQAAQLDGMSGAPQGAYNIVAKRIYRANAGSVSAEYQFETEIGVGVSTYNSNVASENLGEVLATAAYEPPPENLQGIIELPNGGAAGFAGNEVFLAEPYACQAWPYIFATHDPVVGLGAYGNSILIMTTGNPYVLTGDHPSRMSMERLEESHPCLSKRGIVDLGYAVAYPSPSGLIVIGMDVAKNATQDLMSREQWKALDPSSILGVMWRGSYIGFYDNGTAKGAFVIDPRKDFVVFLDVHATAAWCDPATGELYLATGSVGAQQVVRFDGGASFLPREWESGVFVASYPTNFGAAQVLADSYPVGFRLFADGVERYTVEVVSDAPFRLPSGFRAREFSMRLSCTSGAGVKAAFLASTMAELAQV